MSFCWSKMRSKIQSFIKEDGVHAIAIDSTGLKRFGRGEWHREKYELSNKASWRKRRQYGRRNLSELGVQRYQRILGSAMHARVIVNQKQEAMIGRQ